MSENEEKAFNLPNLTPSHGLKSMNEIASEIAQECAEEHFEVIFEAEIFCGHFSQAQRLWDEIGKRYIQQFKNLRDDLRVIIGENRPSKKGDLYVIEGPNECEPMTVKQFIAFPAHGKEVKAETLQELVEKGFKPANLFIQNEEYEDGLSPWNSCKIFKG